MRCSEPYRSDGSAPRYQGAQWLSALLMLLACASPPVPDDAVRVPGTGVALVPPEGFAWQPEFGLFQHPDYEAAITVTQLPEPIQTWTSQPDQGWGGAGTVLDSESVLVGTQQGVFVYLDSGGARRTMMLIFGDSERSLMVIAAFQQDDIHLVGALKQSLLSARWSPEGRQNEFEGLPFLVTAIPPFKTSGRTLTTIILTQEGRPSSGVIAVSAIHVHGEPNLKDLQERLSEHQGLRTISSFDTTVNGLSAREFAADAIASEGGSPGRILCLLATDGVNYFVVRGEVDPANADEFMPKFREIAYSLRTTTP